jgi:hypothetical protein
MTEWLQSKLSEQLHSIMKEPQMTACGHFFRMGKNREIIQQKKQLMVICNQLIPENYVNLDFKKKQILF